MQSYIKCRQRVPPSTCGARRTGPGGGGKMCSGAWKRGPERPVGAGDLPMSIMGDISEDLMV